MHTVTTKTEKPLFAERPTERDPNRVALISRKKGAFQDRRREAGRTACRGKVSA